MLVANAVVLAALLSTAASEVPARPELARAQALVLVDDEPRAPPRRPGACGARCEEASDAAAVPVVYVADRGAAKPATDVAVAPVTLERPGRSKAVPILGLGASVAAGIVGAVFASRAAAALTRQPTTRTVVLDSGTVVVIPDPEGLRAQGEEAATSGLVSLLSFSAAIAGLVTSTLLLLSD